MCRLRSNLATHRTKVCSDMIVSVSGFEIFRFNVTAIVGSVMKSGAIY
jgi:hypothetical protein